MSVSHTGKTTRIALACAVGGWLGLSAGVAAQSATHQPTTTHAFSFVEGHTPRLFFVGRNRELPVKIRNDGYLVWERDRKVYLSYHWLTALTGHRVEEGHRNDLPGEVGPGGSIGLTARVKPPPRAGLYRLEWDMLEEDETWFAELSPERPPPAPLALVLPSVEFFFIFFFPVATLAATWLLLRRERKGRGGPAARAWLAAADLIWAALALYGKPFLLYAELPSRFLHHHSWTALAAIALLLAPVALFAIRWRPWAAWCLVLFGTVYVWGQALYFRFFDDVAATATFFAAGQTGALGESIAALADPRDWLLAVDLIVALPLVRALSRRAVRSRVLTVAILAAAALPFLFLLGSAFSSRETSTRRNLKTLGTVSKHGLFGYQMLDATARAGASMTRRPADPEQVDELVAWFRETTGDRAATGEWAGIARGTNLIAIQVESMQQFVLGLEVAGHEVTPNLNRLSEQALRFGAVYDQTSRGRSSAGDFVAMTSILPVAESVAYEFWQNDYRALGAALAAEGYDTVSAIPYKGSFWNRHLTHPAYGFGTNLFRDDFQRLGIRIGWGINDIEFLRQMVPKLETLQEPFAAWLTTLSLHYPYERFPAALKKVRFGDLERTPLGNYLQAMHLFDRAVGEFFAGLEENGLTARSVIALWGDHDAGLVRNSQFVDTFDLARPAPKRHLFSRVPLLIWVPGAEGAAFDRHAGQTDIAPTLLALLGIDPAPLAYQGRNLLGAPGNSPTVHSRGWSVTDDRFYLASQVDPAKGTCWNLPDLAQLPASACQRQARASLRQLDVAEQVLEYDLQAEISKRLAGSG